MEKIIEWVLPIKTVSEANRSNEHWSAKHKRHKTQKKQVWLAFLGLSSTIPLPCHIKLTRLSSRSLDDDNLLFAFKSIRDYIADRLLPGQQIGRADGDKRITWEYAQEKQKQQAVRIEIFS